MINSLPLRLRYALHELCAHRCPESFESTGWSLIEYKGVSPRLAKFRCINKVFD